VKVLSGYDDSEGARRAVREALPILRAAQAELVLVHVLEVARRGVPPEALARIERAAEHRARDFITGRYDHARVRLELLGTGETVGEALARVAREERADMLLVANQRAKDIRGFYIGSVAQQVIEHAHCPVLVVRA
jgi:nucleotide-binding universal stress UspA family protein